MSRIAIVGPVHPLRGGIAQHTTGILREARSRNHDVRVLSYRRQYPDILFPGRTQLDPGAAPPETSHGVSSPIDSLAPWTWYRAAAEAAAFEPDLVLLQRWHPFFAPPLAVIARRLRGRARVAWMVHNARPHEDGVPWGPLLRFGLHDGDLCLVHAEAEAEALRALGVRAGVRRVPMPTPSEVSRVDASEARARLGFSQGEIVFLFFGHVRRYKGVEVLLEALARLPADGPPWRAVLAGEWYVDRGPSDALISKAGLGDRVRIDDRFVAAAEVDEYFGAATIAVLPYVSGTQSAVVPLAYAYGRPVVTTRVGGLAEAVVEGETGRLVAPGDVDALAAALEDVRNGQCFSAEAIGRAHGAASFSGLVDELEAIVHAPVFP
ncbi:MAG: glycosyltransferase [Candidatus Binatia bacterium]|nr:glycosyltransferase [Candidatus Binatia bacterium]